MSKTAKQNKSARDCCLLLWNQSCFCVFTIKTKRFTIQNAESSTSNVPKCRFLRWNWSNTTEYYYNQSRLINVCSSHCRASSGLGLGYKHRSEVLHDEQSDWILLDINFHTFTSVCEHRSLYTNVSWISMFSTSLAIVNCHKLVSLQFKNTLWSTDALESS